MIALVMTLGQAVVMASATATAVWAELMYSLYGAAAQRARHVESVVALHGSDSGLHGPGGPQQGHAGVCGGEVAVPLEPCLERERERSKVKLRQRL